jgi:hypothetical protein
MLRRTTATPDKTVKFGDGKKREASVTKENGERGYPKYGTKRSQRNKEGLR